MGKPEYAYRNSEFHRSGGYADDGEGFPKSVVSLSTSVFGNGFFVKGFLFAVHHKGISSRDPPMPFSHKIQIHLSAHFSRFGVSHDSPRDVGRFQGGGLFLIVGVLGDDTHTPKSIDQSAFEHSSRRSA